MILIAATYVIFTQLAQTVTPFEHRPPAESTQHAYDTLFVHTFDDISHNEREGGSGCRVLHHDGADIFPQEAEADSRNISIWDGRN